MSSSSKGIFGIVIMPTIDYLLLKGVKFNLWRGQHRVIQYQWQIYTIAIKTLLPILAAEVNQVDNTTKAAAYADDSTAAGKIIHLRNW